MELAYSPQTYLIVFWFFVGMLVGTVFSRVFTPPVSQNHPFCPPTYTPYTSQNPFFSHQEVSNFKKRGTSTPRGQKNDSGAN